MEKCSTLLVISGRKIEIMKWYCYTTINMAKMLTILNADFEEQMEFSYVAGGNVKWYSFPGK